MVAQPSSSPDGAALEGPRLPEGPLLIVVTDRHRAAGGDVVAAAAGAVRGGAGLVILREKDLAAGELLALAERVRAVTQPRALFVVSDRVDVALACGADGAHLGETGLPVGAARRVASGRAGFLLGRSVHSREGAVRAAAEGADYLLVGTIFATASHPGETPAGTEFLAEVAAAVPTPVYAIGGVTAQTASRCIRAGARGVAVIGAVMGAADPEEAARSILRAMRA